MKSVWFKNHWRRLLVDMHIPDWDPSFLSKLDPEEYVRRMVQAGVTSAMVYTNSHVGLSLYPTKTGAMHRGLKGQDFFGRVLDLCHKKDIAVTAYHSLVFNNWAYVNQPDWRIVGPRPGLLGSDRYGTCCPNSPYRDFALAQTAEVCGYDCDSLFFDMTFWPRVCYCPHCIERFRREAGTEPPRVVDWTNPLWVQFQRLRERWIVEFAKLATDQARKVNPKMTVTHQFSTMLHDWRVAVPFDLVDACDYLSGDFYGESIQQSIVCKGFFSLSPQRPFEFHTSRCLDLHDHVTTKSPARLASQAFLAPAHGSAFMFIDAIDPVGTMNAGIYDRIRSVFDRMAPFEPELGGQIEADVAVYYSAESKFDPADTGKSTADDTLSDRPPHWLAVVGACRSLQTHHVPFAVVTKKNLAALDRYQVLVLPDVLMMDDEELAAVRRYVQIGGSLYASFRTSIQKPDGTFRREFGLADLFGVSLAGPMDPALNFFSPAGDEFRKWINPQDHLIHFGGQLPVTIRNAKVLATRTKPYTDPGRGEPFGKTFSSIHSNPPGPAGTEPALVAGTFGKGRVVYAAGALEAMEHEVNQEVFAGIIETLLHRPRWIRVRAHRAFEVTVFDQPERKRLVVSFLNTNPEFAGVKLPVEFEVRAPEGSTPAKVMKLSSREAVAFKRDGQYAQVAAEGIDTFAMFAVEYQ